MNCWSSAGAPKCGCCSGWWSFSWENLKNNILFCSKFYGPILLGMFRYILTSSKNINSLILLIGSFYRARTPSNWRSNINAKISPRMYKKWEYCWECEIFSGYTNKITNSQDNFQNFSHSQKYFWENCGKNSENLFENLYQHFWESGDIAQN